MKQEKELNEAQERGINTVKRRALKHQEKREYFKNEPRSVHIAGSADTTGLKQTVRKEKESLSKAGKKSDTGIAKELNKAKYEGEDIAVIRSFLKANCWRTF